MIIFLILLPTIFTVAILGLCVIYIMRSGTILKRECSEVIQPSTEIKHKKIKKHILQNDALKHDNVRRHKLYGSFLKASPFMKKIKFMKESETRYNG